ncbi:MAG: hypothetical protein HY319_14940 [Armatimonadetes bacterium]|nr:hypothetical protein [Armatimonadota bacterium]
MEVGAGNRGVHLRTLLRAAEKSQSREEFQKHLRWERAPGRPPPNHRSRRVAAVSNFFMSPETMQILRILMDAWLPDFKFGPGKCAVKLSRTPWYWETLTGSLKTIDDWGESYSIRHLILPDHVECCTFAVLDWIEKNIPEAPVNLVDQYHPDTFCDPRSPRYQENYAELSRRCAPEEILSSHRHAGRLGLRFRPITYEKKLSRK